jgi:archaellum component FlaF (FlaF/FlaG flagellin family)
VLVRLFVCSLVGVLCASRVGCFELIMAWEHMFESDFYKKKHEKVVVTSFPRAHIDAVDVVALFVLIGNT